MRAFWDMVPSLVEVDHFCKATQYKIPSYSLLTCKGLHRRCSWFVSWHCPNIFVEGLKKYTEICFWTDQDLNWVPPECLW